MTFTYNRVTLIGHAAAAPETRFTSGGQRVATLEVATDRPVRAGAAQVTDWHRIVCWDRLAEIVVEHVVKGRLLFIEGTITYRTWQDQHRLKHSTTEILARELILLDRRPTSGAHTSTDLAPAPGDEDVEDGRKSSDVR